MINYIPTRWTRPLLYLLGLDVELVTLLIENITLAAKPHVQNAADQSSKGLLLRERLHSEENAAAVAEPNALRPYLSVTAPKHRKALAGLADSLLAEAQLCYTDGKGRRKK